MFEGRKGMPLKTKSAKANKTATIKKKKTPPSKPSAIKKVTPKSKASTIKKTPTQPVVPAVTEQVISEKNPSAETLKKTIAFFYLLSYCPPGMLGHFIRVTTPMRRSLEAESGKPSGVYFTQIIPEVCRRIAAFHLATREPDQNTVQALLEMAQKSDENPESVSAFQLKMAEVAALPGRAKPENRLHRNKGCMLCAAPCRYGYFTLVSEPRFSRLQEMLTAETAKPVSAQSPLGVIYGFTIRHICELTGARESFVAADHLGNLSYCLLMLGMAKSRLALPEDQIRQFQFANQRFIQQSSVY
jgi:hypothetical protein